MFFTSNIGERFRLMAIPAWRGTCFAGALLRSHVTRLSSPPRRSIRRASRPSSAPPLLYSIADSAISRPSTEISLLSKSPPMTPD